MSLEIVLDSVGRCVCVCVCTPIVDIFNFTYQSNRWFNKSKKSHNEEFAIGVRMPFLGSPIQVHIP